MARKQAPTGAQREICKPVRAPGNRATRTVSEGMPLRVSRVAKILGAGSQPHVLLREIREADALLSRTGEKQSPCELCKVPRLPQREGPVTKAPHRLARR